MASQDDYENLATLLKPFHDRAKLAEERLEKLEAALEAQKGPAPRVDRGILDKLIELKSTLEISRAEQLAEREKAAKELATISVEKEKLQYQVVHLKRSLEDADKKLLQFAASKMREVQVALRQCENQIVKQKYQQWQPQPRD